MHTSEQQPNTMNLQSLETELSLSKAEMEEFKKLPKEEQKKQKDKKLARLRGLQVKLDEAIQEAIQTGQIEEVKKLKDELEEEINDLEEIVSYPEKLELPEGAKIFEIKTDLEITSAKIAIAKLEAGKHGVSDYIKGILTKINWQEKLDPLYEIVSISVRELFGDEEGHTYTDIKIKAKKFGLDLVPQSLAPQIRLNYEKDGERTNIAMKAIRGRDGHSELLCCGKDIFDSWLDINTDGRGDDEWSINNRFFFVRK